MVLQACLATALVLPAGALEPTGKAESVKWKRTSAYVLTESGITFDIEGPAAVLIELRGDNGVKGKTVAFEIVRDTTHLSKNRVTFKRGRGPKGMRNAAKLGLHVPEGKHTYTFKTAASKVVVQLATQQRLPKTLALAAAETEIAQPVADTSESPAAPAAPPAPPAAAPTKETEATAAVDGAPVPKADTAPAGKVTEIAAIEAATARAAESVALLESGSGTQPALAAALRVAVYDFELQDVEPKVGKVVSDSLVAEIRKLAGVSAIGMDEIRDMLSHEANKQLLGCESDESCLAEIAGALGVDNLVTGVLSKVGDGHVMVIRRIDQRRAKIAGTFNKRLKAGAGQEFLVAIGSAVEELFQDRQLREGAERGVSREVALRIDPPPLPRWSFFAVAGGAAAAVAAGGIFGMLAQEKEGQFQDKANDGLTTIIDGSELVSIGDAAQQRADLANYSYIGAATLAVSAGVMAFFVDWWGYGEDSE